MIKEKYVLKSTGFSSERFGVCEICKKHASEIFQQSRSTEYKPNQWAYKSHLFGHSSCLEAQQIKSE